jgi:outer membrane protein OmpA-like peptidoglycan-associated protein
VSARKEIEMNAPATALRVFAFTAAAALAAALPAPAAEVNLTAVTFPDGRTIDLPMARTNATPAAAKLEASVKFSGGQARVRVSYRGMEPAILFGGDVSSYVVWAITRDGAVQNLGELVVDSGDASSSGDFSTGEKQFGLLVTAEPYATAGRPGDLVIATSMAADPEKAPSSTFAFGGFRPGGVRAERTSIAGLAWDGRTPVPLVQAERALALAEASGAAALNPGAIAEAKRSLAQARNSTRPGGSAKVVTDYSRRAVALASEAMRDLDRKRDADEAARKKAALEAIAGRAASAEAARARTETTLAEVDAARRRLETDKAALEAETSRLAAEKAELEARTAQLAAEKAELQAEKADLARQRDELAKRLRSSMASIMETRDSARGAVMSLPGISFETGRAALRPAAQITLAKLAAIAQVFPDMNMRIEGYTDSTGKAETNRKLSEARAKSVFDFLRAQGVADTRLAYQGLGAANPVADNATREGRARNRRVEIVAAVGEIKPVAPD